MERLLSEQEYDEVDSCGANIFPYLKAQDAKTAAAKDAEWVEWAESRCSHNHLFVPATGEFIEDELKLMCFQCFQERKKLMGVK